MYLLQVLLTCCVIRTYELQKWISNNVLHVPSCHIYIYGESPKWGLPNGGCMPLSASRAQSSAVVHIVHICRLLVGPFCKRNFRHKLMTIVGNCGQLRTSTLSPAPIWGPPIYYEARLGRPKWLHKYNSEIIVLCNGRVCAIGKRIPRELLCVISVHWKLLSTICGHPNDTDQFLPESPV